MICPISIFTIFGGVLMRRLPTAAPPMTTNSDGWIRTASVTAGHQEAAEHGAEDDDEADDDQHATVSASGTRSQARTTAGSKCEPA